MAQVKPRGWSLVSPGSEVCSGGFPLLEFPHTLFFLQTGEEHETLSWQTEADIVIWNLTLLETGKGFSPRRGERILPTQSPAP